MIVTLENFILEGFIFILRIITNDSLDSYPDTFYNETRLMDWVRFLIEILLEPKCLFSLIL